MTLALILTALAGYLSGAIPSGLLLTRAFGLGDVREIGSGNIGATNVLRTGNKLVAFLTLVFDVAKGFIPVLLARDIALAGFALTNDGGQISAGTFTALTHQAQIAAAFGAFIGHCYPVWLGFRGGKGVATYIGVLLGLSWIVAIAFCALWLLTAVLTRYSSLAALVAAALVPVVPLLMQGHLWLTVALIPLSLLLIWRHRSNIRRLLAGDESRIGDNG
ncbi:MAG: glycerol-3-phosphate 1-O-acyltransferase PlsY [Pseudomonadota bacterium]